jgi:iron complex outermembrane receptor protein
MNIPFKPWNLIKVMLAQGSVVDGITPLRENLSALVPCRRNKGKKSMAHRLQNHLHNRLHSRLHSRFTALALVLATPALWAQQSLPAVTVAAKAAPILEAERADIGGFNQPLAKTPQSISVLGADLLEATASSSLSQAVKLDSSLADNYNTTGFIEGLSVRGFLLDSSAGNNFQRNGLAVSGYVPLALESLERIEVLKGVAGLQSGVSAPGGLVNWVSKKPLPDAFTTVSLGTDSYGGSKVHLDANTTWGTVGVRVNLASENLHTQFDGANGKRSLASIALAERVSSDTHISAELEYQRKQQPSVPGLGLLDTAGIGLGTVLPPANYSRVNLNNQSWTLPFDATTTHAQLAIEHQLNSDWKAHFAVSAQRSTVDDRIAFPDGCSSSANYVYPGLCANGDVDIYDYRSENEQRSTNSWDAKLQGKITAFGLNHRLNMGLAGRDTHADLAPKQAYNFVGVTNINRPALLPADGSMNDLNTNSRERALDGYASLVTDLTPTVQSFVGFRTTRLNRSSERSDGSRAVGFEQTVTTPWLGASWVLNPSTMVYASWGQGVELTVVPNRSSVFANAGAVLPALKSEQTEIGVKWQPSPRLLLTAAVFSIDKPFVDDAVTANGLLQRVAGGKQARHRGLELSAVGQVDSQLSIQASYMFLDAQYTAVLDPALAGMVVTNVPKNKASLFADYKIASVAGLSLNGLLSAESGKAVTADAAVMLPSAWQLDAGVRYRNQLWGKATVWNVNVENLTDRNYWREAPTQYWGGVYLFPSTPRTIRAKVTVEF